jgi:hypothetical protein
MWISVADPGCLSWIRDPDFYPSRVPDPLSWIRDPRSLAGAQCNPKSNRVSETQTTVLNVATNQGNTNLQREAKNTYRGETPFPSYT